MHAILNLLEECCTTDAQKLRLQLSLGENEKCLIDWKSEQWVRF
jgi:hypothetical protein